MAPLAKLPVFWALEGKRAIVAGGSDAAAWKAELLAACGAEVHVYAEELSETFSNLIIGVRTSERAFRPSRSMQWNAAAFDGAAIAIADCEDDGAAAHFFDAACKAGVPVNVIDKPEILPVPVRLDRQPFARRRRHLDRWRSAHPGAGDPPADRDIAAAVAEVLGGAGACHSRQGQCAG